MHKIAQKSWSEGIFKAYDIRGKYPEEINEDAAYRIARAFARYLRLPAPRSFSEGGGSAEGRVLKIVISSDARISSPALKVAFLDGLLDEGAEIIDAGLTTTPMHYFIVNKTEADGGAMITASHNPAEFNGVKLSKKGAVPIGEGAGMEEIRNDAVRGIFTAPATPQHPMSNPKRHRMFSRGGIRNAEFLNDYIDFLTSHFPLLTSYSVSLVACLGNGMTSILIRKLFEKFPKIKIKFLHDDLDLTFPNHEANPLKIKNLQDVQSSVLDKKADLGISFDGDGDRVGFIDERGEIVRGDIITALLVRYFTWKPGFHLETGFPIIYDLRSSRVVREEIERLGMRPVESRVGHVFIKRLMRRESAIFGGEVSGHYYFRDFFYADSAVFAMLALLDLMRIEKKHLSELVKPLLRYAKSDELNYEVKNKEKILDMVASRFLDAKISYLDGIKVEYWDDSTPAGERWWFNLRPSNTEDLVRLNIEAATLELLSEKKKLLEELLGA